MQYAVCCPWVMFTHKANKHNKNETDLCLWGLQLITL